MADLEVKGRCRKGLRSAMRLLFVRHALDMFEQQYRAEVVDPHESAVPIKKPTLRERRLHELTHLPFRQWCPHCVAYKSRPDHQQRSVPSEVASRENPTSTGGSYVWNLWRTYIDNGGCVFFEVYQSNTNENQECKGHG